MNQREGKKWGKEGRRGGGEEKGRRQRHNVEHLCKVMLPLSLRHQCREEGGRENTGSTASSHLLHSLSRSFFAMKWKESCWKGRLMKVRRREKVIREEK